MKSFDAGIRGTAGQQCGIGRFDPPRHVERVQALARGWGHRGADGVGIQQVERRFQPVAAATVGADGESGPAQGLDALADRRTRLPGPRGQLRAGDRLRAKAAQQAAVIEGSGGVHPRHYPGKPASAAAACSLPRSAL